MLSPTALKKRHYLKSIRPWGLTQIKPVWVGDLGTRLKNPKFLWFRLENRHFVFFSAKKF
jgi:hypothetical protein